MIQTLLEAGLRKTLQRVVKPMLNARMSVPIQRVLIRQVYHTSTPPKGCRFQRANVGGVSSTLVSHRDCNPVTKSAVLYLHGGAYIIGSSKTHRGIAGHLAMASRSTLVVPDYRLAPEHPFPAALEDATACYQALLEEGYLPTQIALAGDSAGGGLVLALAMRLRDAGLPLPGSLTVFSPWTDLTHTALYEPECEPVLQKAWIDKAAALYCASYSKTMPYISPIYGDLQGLPPLLIQVGSQEILLNDAQRLADRAREYDVDTKLEIYNSLWHVFQVHAGQLDRATEALATAGAHIKTHWAATPTPGGGE
ncbi:alpha/beta hydrolase [Marinobacter caseinilyticus]|uniref:alpha/beta hydrolase n=1 Tax=Marinobacter caseinilyticus TaxID=2692195 RepID=UPI00140CDCB1|nr:alpha/beta hydrolase [Marinobacter caseinilyticus]